MNNLDRSFDALAHPARRAILARLARGSATVKEAAHGLTLSKPAITKHLRVLEDTGLVTRTIEGRTHRLELRTEPLAAAESWIERHRVLWEAKFDAVERHLASEDRKERG